MNDTHPSLLVIDDDPEPLSVLRLRLEGRAEVQVRHPADLEDQDLKAADLVLVDYELTEWSARTEGKLARRVYDGLALVGALRRAAYHLTKADPEHSPTAFAIYSGRLEDLAGHLPPARVPHQIARIFNLEWAFQKAGSTSEFEVPGTEDQFVILASAVRKLPDVWRPTEFRESEAKAAELLGLVQGDAPTWGSREWEENWRAVAWDEALEAHPPIFELYERTHGLALIRWLLQRIFPYPTYLWDARYLAARIGVAGEDVAGLVSDDKLREIMRPYEYTGLLQGFSGPRWWRAGVEEVLWQLTNGESNRIESVRRALSEQGVILDGMETYQTVVTVDEDFRPSNILVSPDKAVRISTDDWPPFADAPWISLDRVVELPALRSLVIPDDRHLLPEL